MRVRILGNLSYLPVDLRETVTEVERVTEANTESLLNIALSYTAREEITHAVRELAVSLAEDRLGQVGFLLSALGRERRTEDNRPGPAASAQTRELLLSDIETYIRQIGECTSCCCFHFYLTLHTLHLESGQNTLTEVAESLKSVLRSHMRTEMGEDNLSASQSHLPTGEIQG